MTAMLAHRGRRRAGRAKQMVGDARALRDMPETTERLQRGEISADESRPLIAAHQAHPTDFAAHETSLCNAVQTTRWVRDAYKAIDYWRQAVSGPSDDRRRYDEREFTYSRTLDGMIDFRGRLGAETAEAFVNRVEAATSPPSPGDDRTPASDALTHWWIWCFLMANDRHGSR